MKQMHPTASHQHPRKYHSLEHLFEIQDEIIPIQHQSPSGAQTFCSSTSNLASAVLN